MKSLEECTSIMAYGICRKISIFLKKDWGMKLKLASACFSYGILKIMNNNENVQHQ